MEFPTRATQFRIRKRAAVRQPFDFFGRRSIRRCRRIGERRCADGTIEELEEIRLVRRKDQRLAAGAKRLVIGSHRTIELVEVGIAFRGIGEDGVALGFTLTTQDFRVPSRIRDDFDNLTVRNRAAALAFFVTSGADQLRFRQTFGLHAVVGILRHLLRQVRAADADILDVETKRLRIAMQIVTHFGHHGGAFVGERRFETTQTVDTAQRGVEAGSQTRFRRITIARYRLAELAGVGDLVDDESIDLIELAARNLNADIVQIETKLLLLDVLDAVGIHEGERQLEIEARLGLDGANLAEAQHDGLLAGIDHEHRRIDEQQHHRKRDENGWQTAGRHYLASG
ncbi:hypothetical protein RHSP_46070 [Rhizobium freirei PRF 81]|uniref:Uncharacterized protein n=1 Tax=Rhizobium freirei PRF 81 TaxID=363754 RepID=N6U508_9HYPH|nr:hypothetical protein RHSP_46070 [Rhizobium freirei PRF 81]